MSDFYDVPRKYYPDYHFKRVRNGVQIVTHINGVRYGGTFELEGLDREYTTTTDPDFKFVIEKATQFLLEERWQ